MVGPGKFELQLAPGQTRTVEMTVTNRTGVERIVSLTKEDFTSAATDSDSLVELLGDAVGPYTLKDYISVPHTTFLLEHGQRARIPVTISLPTTAEPGGFYGSLLTQITSLPTDETVTGVNSTAPLVSRISTLFLSLPRATSPV